MADEKDVNSGESNTEQAPDTSRRRFMKNSGMIVGGVAGGSLLGGLFTNQFKSDNSTPPKKESERAEPTEARMFFTRTADFLVLEQATERIYPKDDNGPGAIELDIPFYIDKQLAGSWGLNAKNYRQAPFEGSEATTDQSRLTRGELFIDALRKMNQLSNERFNKTFDKAEEDQQIEILQDFENGKVKMKGVASADFFSLLRNTTLEGAYSDPLYGGNKNMEGWKMKEFPGAVTSYTDMIEEDEFIKMDPISLTDYQQK